jgi:hypothetical protein
MYSSRQRELRERRTSAVRDEDYWLSDRVAVFEIEESLDFEAPTSWNVAPRRRASAA